ncbi:hypothetical protein J5O02_09550, partial [Streptococcus suis]|uniref:hypothetical protein n=1 Tax=Streptococcus suis TaxID=1307 RepID=UPI001ABE629F
PFLSPLPHDSQAWESLWGSPVAGVHGGLSPQMYDMPVVHKKLAGMYPLLIPTILRLIVLHLSIDYLQSFGLIP